MTWMAQPHIDAHTNALACQLESKIAVLQFGLVAAASAMKPWSVVSMSKRSPVLLRPWTISNSLLVFRAIFWSSLSVLDYFVPSSSKRNAFGWSQVVPSVSHLSVATRVIDINSPSLTSCNTAWFSELTWAKFVLGAFLAPKRDGLRPKGHRSSMAWNV